LTESKARDSLWRVPADDTTYIWSADVCATGVDGGMSWFVQVTHYRRCLLSHCKSSFYGHIFASSYISWYSNIELNIEHFIDINSLI